tara:strand:+ start:486 stop:764 length:279 start_codon:yes stop_codon:yes gene_type:complete
LHDYTGVFKSVSKGIRKELVPNLRLEITAAVPVLLVTAPSAFFLVGVCCEVLFLPKTGAAAVSSGIGAGGLGSGILGGGGGLGDRKHIIKCY